MITDQAPAGPGRPLSGKRRALSVVVVAGVGVFAFANRGDVQAFGSAIRTASPAWMAVAVAIALAGIAFGYSGTHRVAVEASGVPIGFGLGIRLGVRAFALNTLVKSGGLAGIVPYLRHAESTGVSRSRARTGYLLANVLGDAAIAVSLIVALVVLTVEHRLSRAVIAASVVFSFYLASIAVVVVAAARSREAVRRLHAWPRRAIAAIRRRPQAAVDHTAADEMHAAIAQLRARPFALVPALGWALLVDIAGVATLAVVMRAFGQTGRLSVALSAYAVSMLFALLSFLPGGLGFAEVSLAAVLVSFGVPAPVAAAIAVTDRFAETWIPTAIGLLIRPGRTARAESVPVESPSPTGVSKLRTRRLTALAVVGLGLVQLWLGATRRPLIDSSAVALDPRSGALRDSRYILLACGLALLVAARGLSRGSQRAWIVATGVTIVSVFVHPIGRGDLLGALLGLVIASALIWKRTAFRSRTDTGSSRAALAWLLGGAVVVVAYGTIGLYFMDTEIAEGTSLWRAFDSALRLLFILPPTTLSPLTRHANWFIDSVRVLGAAVLVIGVTMLTRPVLGKVRQRRGDRERVATVLQEYGTTGLAHFHLLPEKSFVFSADERAFVGFRRVGAVAVALGEPIGPQDSVRDAARVFLTHCDANGWTPAFHQVTPSGLDALRSLGLHVLKIGEEAIIDLRHFSLEGKHFKRLRTQLRQLAGDGIVVEELAKPISEATMSELRAVSDTWLADGGHRERTFTLGGFDEAELRRTRVLVAKSPGRIEAFVNIIPSYVGSDGNFDLMRRRPDAPNSIMDLLLVSLAELFRSEGRTGMNLGLAPLTNLEGGGLAARALRVIAERDSKAFNFKGLRAYKDKWRPDWDSRYLVYPSDLSLLRVGYAVARVGELRSLAPPFLRFGLTDVPGAAPIDEARSGLAEAELFLDDVAMERPVGGGSAAA